MGDAAGTLGQHGAQTRRPAASDTADAIELPPDEVHLRLAPYEEDVQRFLDQTGRHYRAQVDDGSVRSRHRDPVTANDVDSTERGRPMNSD